MKKFLKFICIFGGILLLSAFLAPILYDFFQTFHPYKFERIHNRLVMIGTLVAAVFFVRIKKETLTKFGLIWGPSSFRLLTAGFLTSIVMLGAVGVLGFLSGRSVWDVEAMPWTQWVAKFTAALGTGLLIGVMEEFFFRGFIFRSLQTAFKNKVFLSVLVTTFFYSVIHFIGMKKIFVDSDPNFIDGLRLIGAPFISLAAWPQFWPQAVGLFIFGLALNGAVCRSGSLYPSIGLHAGCVFFIRLDDLFTKFQGGKSLFWGSKILYDGIVGWLFLILMTVFLWSFLKPTGVVTTASDALPDRKKV